MKILAIILTHGDELLGSELLQYMLTQRSPLLEQVEFIVANPRAYSQNVRYCESDLNRSYGVDIETYEASRAEYITERICLLQPDLVLDFHTTTAEQPDVLITARPDDAKTARFIAASSLQNVLVVESLNDITTVAPHFVAYEVSNSHLSTPIYAQICDDIQRYLDGAEAGVEHTMYRMTGKITEEEVKGAADVVNFAYHKKLGYIPSFIGEKAYEQDGGYVGFRLKLID